MNGDLVLKAARSLEDARFAKSRVDQNLKILDEKLRQNQSDKLLDLMASQNVEDKEKLERFLIVQKTFEKSVNEVEEEVREILRNKKLEREPAAVARTTNTARFKTTTASAAAAAKTASGRALDIIDATGDKTASKVNTSSSMIKGKTAPKLKPQFQSSLSLKVSTPKPISSGPKPAPSNIQNQTTSTSRNPMKLRQPPRDSRGGAPPVSRPGRGRASSRVPRPDPVRTESSPLQYSRPGRGRTTFRVSRPDPLRTASSPAQPFVAVPLSLPRVWSSPYVRSFAVADAKPRSVEVEEEEKTPTVEVSSKETQYSEPIRQKVLTRHFAPVLQIEGLETEESVDSGSKREVSDYDENEEEEEEEERELLESERLAKMISGRDRLVEKASALLEREILRIVEENLRGPEEDEEPEVEEGHRLILHFEDQKEEAERLSEPVDPYLLKGLVEDAIAEQLRSMIQLPAPNSSDKEVAPETAMPKTPPVTPPPPPLKSPTTRIRSQFDPTKTTIIKTPPRTPSPVEKTRREFVQVFESESVACNHWIHEEPIRSALNREIPSEPRIPTPQNSAPSSPREENVTRSSSSSPSRRAVTPVQTPPVSPSLPVSPDFMDLPAPRSSAPPSMDSESPEREPEVEFVSIGVGGSVEAPEEKPEEEGGASEATSSPISSSLSSSLTSYAPNATSISEGQVVSYSIKPIDAFSFSEPISELKSDGNGDDLDGTLVAAETDPVTEEEYFPQKHDSLDPVTEEPGDVQFNKSPNQTLSEGEVNWTELNESRNH